MNIVLYIPPLVTSQLILSTISFLSANWSGKNPVLLVQQQRLILKWRNYANLTLTLSNENKAGDGDDDQSQDLGHSEDILDSSGSSHTDQVHKGQYT